MSQIDRQNEILTVRGMDYSFAAGINDNGRRVVVLRMREAGTPRWVPVIEMDVDIPSFYRDTIANFDFRQNPPIPQ